MIKVLPLKTAKEVVARERDRKARTTLLMALPEDHLAKFHKMTNAKEMYEAIKSRFQNLLSQLEIHGAGVSHEDANQKCLSFDDLYNNLRVSKRHVKGTTASSSNTQNVAFVSAENTSSTNDINDDDMEEMNLKWQVAMIFIRIKKDCRAKGNQDSRRRDAGYNRNKTKDNGKRPAYQDDSKDLVTINGEDIDWFGHVEEDAQNYAMMAYSSSNSGFNNKSVFMNKASDLEDTSVNDKYADGMHAVPPPMTGNYMPSRPDVEINYSKFTYGPKQTSIDELDSKPIENAPKVVCETKVWTDAPIIEEYESDSDNDDPHRALKDKRIVDSGYSRHMTRNKAHVADYQEFKGGFVAFGGSNGRITGNGKIKAG
nr:hypothetical protein [Tanacetum cinerariifolium]